MAFVVTGCSDAHTLRKEGGKPDCAHEWNKLCPALEEWEPVACSEAGELIARGQLEARFHFDSVVSGDCAFECGRSISVSIPRLYVTPYVRKALRRRADCRHCEIERLEDYALRDVETDLIAGWSYGALHPRRPFYPYSDVVVVAAQMSLVRRAGDEPEPAFLIRSCPDGRVGGPCERLLFGEDAIEEYWRAARLEGERARAIAREER